MKRSRWFIATIGAVVASLAIVVAASAGNNCPAPLPDPINFPVSCSEQADPFTAAALANPTYEFADNGGVYTSDPIAAQAYPFAVLILPTTPIYVSGKPDTSVGVLELTGFLRLAKNCSTAMPRKFPVCYGNYPNSMDWYTVEQMAAIFGDSIRIPVASTHQVTDFKVGDHWLTCNSNGQMPTGRVVSTGNGGEVVPDNSVGMSYVHNVAQLGNYTIEVS